MHRVFTLWSMWSFYFMEEKLASGGGGALFWRSLESQAGGCRLSVEGWAHGSHRGPGGISGSEWP